MPSGRRAWPNQGNSKDVINRVRGSIRNAIGPLAPSLRGSFSRRFRRVSVRRENDRTLAVEDFH